MSFLDIASDALEAEIRKEAERRRIEAEIKIREENVRRYRAEASRKASMANKRVARLEANDLQDTPAYHTYLDGGRFSVKGKSHRELQKEVARLDKFIESQTSTVRGANAYLKQLAETTGMSYSSLSELKSKAKNFFELSSKVEQYLRTVEDKASAINYQKVWEMVNRYSDTGEIKIDEAEADIDSMIEILVKAIEEEEQIEDLERQWFSV